VARTLDPALLDPIVAGLDLTELATLDRTLFAMRLLLDDIEAWLRRLANDEDSWLNRLADLLGAGTEFADGAGFPDLLALAIPLLVIAAVISATAIFFWRRHSRRPSTRRPTPDLPALPPTPTSVDASDTIDTLPAREQAAALFRRACDELANRGALTLADNLTNSALARRARVSGIARQALQHLANGADRVLFGGWLPSDAELRQLHTEYRTLMTGSTTRT